MYERKKNEKKTIKKKNHVLKRPRHSSLVVPPETWPVEYLVQMHDRLKWGRGSDH